MKLVVLNQKGGVGKSTVSSNLAYGLAMVFDPKSYGAEDFKLLTEEISHGN